jgi:hypothetical protein
MLPDWSGRTVVCIASGPSLTVEDCEAVKASGHPTVVTNTTFRTCTWADVLFGFDEPWWRRYIDEVKAVFHGLLFSKSPVVYKLGVECAHNDRRFVSFGLSGTDAISLAFAAGSKRILMLGYDSQFTDGKSHHHGDHPKGLNNCGSIHSWPVRFGRLSKYAKNIGVSIINVSRVSALTCFERDSLEACL